MRLREGGRGAASEIGQRGERRRPACIFPVSQVSKVSQVVLIVEVSAILESCWQNEAPSRLAPLPRRGRPVRTNLGNGRNGSPDCGSDSWRKGRGNGNGQTRPESSFWSCWTCPKLP